MDTEQAIRQLTETYQRELALYQSVLKLTDLQNTALTGQSIGDFIILLHQKEDLLRIIDTLDEKLGAAKEVYVQAGMQDPVIGPVLDTIIHTIGKIMELEETNETLLRSRRGEIERELAEIKTQQAARRAVAGIT